MRIPLLATTCEVPSPRFQLAFPTAIWGRIGLPTKKAENASRALTAGAPRGSRTNELVRSVRDRLRETGTSLGPHLEDALEAEADLVEVGGEGHLREGPCLLALWQAGEGDETHAGLARVDALQCGPRQGKLHREDAIWMACLAREEPPEKSTLLLADLPISIDIQS